MTRPTEAFLPLTHVAYHVLLSLSFGARHGYGIIKDVEKRTHGEVSMEAGTLYGAIKRLRDDGLIQEEAAPAEADARRKYYALTPFGREVLSAESLRLAELVDFAREARVLPPAPVGGPSN